MRSSLPKSDTRGTPAVEMTRLENGGGRERGRRGAIWRWRSPLLITDPGQRDTVRALHLVTISNGTLLDLPSAEIVIVPASTAIKLSLEFRSSTIGEVNWPQTVISESTGHDTAESVEDRFRYGYRDVALKV